MEKVLIVVDMQKGFMTRDCYKNLSKKIDSFIIKNHYDKIILTRFVNKKGSLYETKMNWTNLQDEESQAFSINVPQNAIIFEKYGYGLSDEQVEFIKNLNTSCVDICGLQTDACVYAIALQLFDNGIFPNILINYVATSVNEDAIKQILLHQFGKVDDKE